MRPRSLQLLHDLPDLLVVRPVGDQHHVGGGHHDGVLEPQRGQQHPVGAQVAPAAAVGHHVAEHDVAGLVLVAHLPQARPAAHVVPADVGVHDGGPTRVLHDRVVHRDRRGPGELLLVEAHEVQVDPGGPQGAGDRLEDVGPQPLELLEEQPGREHEHPAVPAPVPGGDEVAGERPGRLLHEVLHLEGGVVAGQPHPGADVAEPGLRPCRGHPERDEVPLDGHRGRGPHGAPRSRPGRRRRGRTAARASPRRGRRRRPAGRPRRSGERCPGRRARARSPAARSRGRASAARPRSGAPPRTSAGARRTRAPGPATRSAGAG